MAKFVPYRSGISEVPTRPCIEVVGTRYVTALSRINDDGTENGKDDHFQEPKKIRTYIPIGERKTGRPLPNHRFENVEAILNKGWQVVKFHNLHMIDEQGRRFVPPEYRELVERLEGLGLVHGEDILEGVTVERENRFTKRTSGKQQSGEQLGVPEAKGLEPAREGSGSEGQNSEEVVRSAPEGRKKRNVRLGTEGSATNS